LNYVNQTQENRGNDIYEDNETQYYFLNCSQFMTNGYIIACIVLIATLLQSTLSNNFNHLVIAEGIHLKSALNVWKLLFIKFWHIASVE
jgi:hypothetical protein